MFVIGTSGPDQPNLAGLPFVALKGSVDSGEFPDEEPAAFLMQEAVYLADRKTDIHQVKPVGLPTVGEVVEYLTGHGLAIVVCEPCAVARGIRPGDLVDGARMGTAGDLAALSKAHEVTLTF